MAFLTHNPVALSLGLSNPFWTQVLERWKALHTNLYSTPTHLIHTNICHSKLTNFLLSIPPYKYIPLYLITDECMNILPKSQLSERLPLATWQNISPTLVQFGTSRLRNTILKAPQLSGNYAPFVPPEFLLTNPNIKGCKHILEALSNSSFDPKCWANFNKFSTDHHIPLHN